MSSRRSPSPKRCLGDALNEIKFTPQSVDEEDSILNTPKSLLLTTSKSESALSTVEESGDAQKINKKELFPSSTTLFVPQMPEEYANLPSMIITDFE
ncbi:Hypothetical protein FKW44_014171 [Caligus rogercresseyi]|uniref:Uncharacterized protein n=1 Tax=Caligus rogercresseyi TaxID=217165 RepID=A0A7T8JYS4_CALRO|nr:Hypothetical protein FKW44_014171 [Caligus rogercresseyi]